MLPLLVAFLVACVGQTQNHVLYLDDRCPEVVQALDGDTAGSAGFTGQELYDQAVVELGSIEVAWQPERTPTQDVFTVELGPPTAFAEVTRTGCAEIGLDHVSLEVEAEAVITSADGEVTASGPVTLTSSDLSQGVFLQAQLEPTVTGAHLAEITAGFQRVDGLSLGSSVRRPGPYPSFVLNVWGADADGHEVSSAFYRCYEDAGDDCFRSASE